jgi:hypothetical protein
MQKKFCPSVDNEYVNICYYEYVEQEHTISILFYEVLDLLFIMNLFLNTNTSSYCRISIAIHNTINIHNNLLCDYDNYYKYEHKRNINKILSKKYENFNNIYIDDPESKIFNLSTSKFVINLILNDEIKRSHMTNINRMINLETNPIYKFITCDKLFQLPNGKIFNYTKSKLMECDKFKKTKIKGGTVIENPQLNNIFQVLYI